MIITISQNPYYQIKLKLISKYKKLKFKNREVIITRMNSLMMGFLATLKLFKTSILIQKKYYPILIIKIFKTHLQKPSILSKIHTKRILLKNKKKEFMI